jgi:hypothetical protein
VAEVWVLEMGLAFPPIMTCQRPIDMGHDGHLIPASETSTPDGEMLKSCGLGSALQPEMPQSK